MIEEIFSTLPESFVPETISQPKSFYFSLGEIKKTVELNSDSCRVTDGKALENADCVCKTSPEFFLKIWQDNYRPGMKDFMIGTIKSNNPSALLDFLRCFGK
ncbi:MAG: hypothetical protein OEL83_01780 [Desulforhopalus sp.]|nr:hypothetical protein [Desulforhopalus sp.]